MPSLVIGEAIIEGIGASFMLPATMSIMSSTFVGHERATAFSAWGAVLGAAVAFGPLLGGFLTTQLLVALGVPHQRDRRADRDPRRAALRAPHSPIANSANASTFPARC